MVKRLRAVRPEPEFAISLRIGCSAANVDALNDTLSAYAEAGVQHILIAPDDRDLPTYQNTIERIAKIARKA